MCVLTVASETTSRSAISRLVKPGADQAEHLGLARGETVGELDPRRAPCGGAAAASSRACSGAASVM